MTLRTIRRVYSIFFFALFIILLLTADFSRLKGYEVSFFLDIDPLASISAFLTSWTVYQGMLLSLLVIIPTIIFGRFFCSWICPMGILNQWISQLLNKRRAIVDIKINTYRPIFQIKYFFLTIFLVLSALGALQIGLMDPISIITRSFTVSILPLIHFITGWGSHLSARFNGGILISIIFLMILFSNRIYTRFWCRVLCPLGGLLGIMSGLSIFKIYRNKALCTDCNKCLKSCHGGCDPHSELKHNECLLCMNCVEECPEGALHYGIMQPQSVTHAKFDINRRRIIETAIIGGALYPMLRSSISSATVPTPALIRPPGSINEADFLKRCIKCGECMKVCPTNVLSPALLEAGLEGFWTPTLINRIGYCEYNCVLCSTVCPTGAIMHLTVQRKTGKGEFDKNPVRIGTAFYDRGRCLPWAMNTECIVCEEVCPTSPKAITFDIGAIAPNPNIAIPEGTKKVLKQPRVLPEHCIGCGICENKCPVHDRAAIYVTSVGESRSKTNKMILRG
ncbi:MAG: 4Fe-4S binding protein [Nitrospirae bacterium]|nr:4Fe-4S binding protein [Nitrospirota bacterium]